MVTHIREMDVLKWKKKRRGNKSPSPLLAAVYTGRNSIVPCKKMSTFRLERFVIQLVQHSKDGYDNGRIRPKWWPKHLKFQIPLRKLKTYMGDNEWSRCLYKVIASCSEFYKFNVIPNIVLQGSFIQTPDSDYFDSWQPSVSNGCWTYKCRANNRAILVRQRHEVEDNHKLSLSDNSCVPSKSVAIKLHDITKTPLYLCSILKVPKVELIDIVKHPPTPRRGKRKLLTSLKENGGNKLINHIPHVRLEDLFKTPKDIHYSKDDYMRYFNLSRDSENSEVPMKHNAVVLSKILRNSNIPLSSDLGRFSLKKLSAKCDLQRRTQKLEWFLREVPEVKVEQEYTVTYSEDIDLESAHNYVFPKRQNHQIHASLRSYGLLKMCRPLTVKLDLMDLNQFKDKYKITL